MGTNIGEVFDFDVTEATQEMVNDPSANFGFLIKTEVNQRQGHFASNENDTARGPQLIIEVDQTQLIEGCVKKHNSIKTFIKNGCVNIYLPFEGDCCVSIYDLNGKLLKMKNIKSSNSWHKIEHRQSNGAKVITINANGYNFKKIITISE